jgi:hypothetical protein
MSAPDMAEVEKLAHAYADAKLVRYGFHSADPLSAHPEQACTALLDYVRGVLTERDALIADNERLMQIAAQESDVGARVLREVFALCEDTQDKCSEDANDFTRGRRFEAKGIARAIGTWYQDEFCGRTHMGEPTPAPDPFRDAAKMVQPVSEVPMPKPVAYGFGNTAITGHTNRLMMVRIDIPGDDQYAGAFWLPLVLADEAHIYGIAREAAGYAAGVAAGGELTAAARSVLDERQRQISQEGWTPEHDDAHDRGELAVAAALYILRKGRRSDPTLWLTSGDRPDWRARFLESIEGWIKPSSPRRGLVKAGALILAEIERLDRAALRGEVKP